MGFPISRAAVGSN